MLSKTSDETALLDWIVQHICVLCWSSFMSVVIQQIVCIQSDLQRLSSPAAEVKCCAKGHCDHSKTLILISFWLLGHTCSRLKLQPVSAVMAQLTLSPPAHSKLYNFYRLWISFDMRVDLPLSKNCNRNESIKMVQPLLTKLTWFYDRIELWYFTPSTRQR